MKTKIDVNHLGRSIKAVNKWNEIQLIIDDVVCGSYKAVIAGSFELNAMFESEGSPVYIQLRLELRPFGGVLVLTANAQEIARKWIL